MLPRELLADDLRRGLCLCDGHAGLEPRGQLELSLAAILQRAFRERRIDWHPELTDERRRACASKATRHHAKNLERPSAEQDSSADDCRVTGKARAPRSFGEHDDIGAGLRRQIRTTQLCGSPEHREVVGRCRFAGEFRRAVVGCQRPRRAGVHRDVREDLAARHDVPIGRPGRLALPGIHTDDLFRCPDRQRLESQRVHEAEDGGVAANGQRECQDGHQSKTQGCDGAAGRRTTRRATVRSRVATLSFAFPRSIPLWRRLARRACDRRIRRSACARASDSDRPSRIRSSTRMSRWKANSSCTSSRMSACDRATKPNNRFVPRGRIRGVIGVCVLIRLVQSP